jgi:predicted nucleic acid-binding protein
VSDVVYLDVCCLKRPFDDQRSTRIQLEAAAVAALIDRAERGGLQLARSPAHVLENDRNPREDRRLAASIWLEAARVEVSYSEAAETRAREIRALGFSMLDALHTAFAEASGARWLVTTDDRFVALGRKHREALRVEVTNPIHVLELFAGGWS